MGFAKDFNFVEEEKDWKIAFWVCELTSRINGVEEGCTLKLTD